MDGAGDDSREVRRTRFKLSNKRESLELLGRHLRLFTDRVEHVGNLPPAPDQVDYSRYTEQELEELERLLMKGVEETVRPLVESAAEAGAPPAQDCQENPGGSAANER